MKTMSLRIGVFVLLIPSSCPLWEASSYVVGQLAKPLLQPLALSAGNQVLLLCFNVLTYNQETQHDISLNHPMNIWKSGQRWRLMMFGLGKHHETSSCCGVSPLHIYHSYPVCMHDNCIISAWTLLQWHALCTRHLWAIPATAKMMQPLIFF